MKKRRAKRVSYVDLIQDELATLTIRMNELEGLGRCIEGELEMLHELIKKKEEE
jgi:hypothetical protein